ncbi:hypothetical protein [Comamonas sp. NoAH]|uniref:hypothetical protein n=1 Tax=Comamonas halotolerans TaxID=3041496 RepID=UPI0024E0D597|nr:hypothetical protein [Comamonas sp. NoAH]
MTTRFKLQAIGLAGIYLLCAVLWAKPAPWFWWISKHDGRRVCAQSMPSQGWEKAGGPFDNPRCQVRATVGTPGR